MLIITRYFTREFLKVLLLCLATFVALYLMVDLFDRMDDIIKREVSLSLVVQYCLCAVPLIVYQVCPLGVLLSTFITIGLFVRHHEITALKAHGISLFRVLKVFILVSFCLFLFSLWMQEYLMPFTTSRFKEIKTVHIKGRKRAQLSRQTAFWYRTPEAIYNIDFFDPDQNLLQRVAIMYLDDDFQTTSRIDAKTGHWTGEAWELRDGVERIFHADGTMVAKAFTTKTVSLNNTPDDFQMSRKGGDEMSFSELRTLIQKIRRGGYPSTAYEVDMHAKISYSFINVIMALLGIPFALRIGRSGGMALGIAISISIGLLYWLFFAFCLSLGKGAALTPFMSAWIANLVFGMLGMYMFLQVRQ